MSGPKHTPGPWRIDVDESAHVKVIRDVEGRLVAELFRLGFDDDPEHHANARLVASAPRLAEALKQCIFRLTVSEEAFRQQGNQNWSSSLAQTLEVARAALREAGVEP